MADIDPGLTARPDHVPPELVADFDLFDIPGGEDDVRIGTWSMPWNAKPDVRRLASTVPKSHYWATDPRGIDQVGCVYTPRVVGLRVGQTLEVKNSDDLLHNVHSISNHGNDFNVGDPLCEFDDQVAWKRTSRTGKPGCVRIVTITAGCSMPGLCPVQASNDEQSVIQPVDWQPPAFSPSATQTSTPFRPAIPCPRFRVSPMCRRPDPRAPRRTACPCRYR